MIFSDYELNADNIHLSFSLINNTTLDNVTQECRVGDEIKLEVIINTIPNDPKLYNKYLTLEWRKDGTKLSQNKQYLIERNDSIASITITLNAKLGDTGVYELRGQYLNLANASISVNVMVNNISKYYYKDPKMSKLPEINRKKIKFMTSEID